MIPVPELHAETLRLEEAEFVARHPHPAFLVNPGSGEVDASRFEEHTPTLRRDGPEPEDWITQTHDELCIASALAELPLDDGATEPGPSDRQALADGQRVAFVTKRARNPFPDMVTIGRVPNNDLVFGYPTISKVHAYLRRDAAGSWWLHDQRSRNGTWLSGARLEAGEKAQVTDGAWVHLGPSLVLQFLEPPSLFGYLRGLDGASRGAGIGP